MQSAENLCTFKPGQRLACPACDTEVIVIRVPAFDVSLACGGESLGDIAAPRPKGGHAQAEENVAQLGKRYFDQKSGLELLCTRPGSAALSCNGVLLDVKRARPLPSSD